MASLSTPNTLLQQVALSQQKPFVAACTRSVRTASVTVCKAQLDATTVSRRAAAASLTSIPALLAASKALALIPDDDDEELIEKAKANRRRKLVQERNSEKEFAKNEGFAEADLVPVQKAIRQLAQSGAQLESGDLPAVASSARGSWVDEFDRASKGLSTSDGAKKSAADVVSAIAALGTAAGRGSVPDTKRGYVAVVTSFKAWASAAGISSSLKGL